MTMSKITFFFKDLFPDLDTFKTVMAQYSFLNTTDAIHTTLYRYLYNRYCNSNVLYITEDGFYRNFFLVYDDVFEQYKKRLELIGLMYNITPADLVLLNESINAIANNDDTALSNPLDHLAEYVSMQQGMKSKGNKFVAYLDAIDRIKDKLIGDFLKQFQNLFFWLAVETKELY